MEERIQKIMAQAGLGSRRDCEEYIIAGRVRVNGVLAELGQKADPAFQTITLDGRAIKPPQEKIYIALHKPRYVLSTVDAEQGDSRQTVRNLIPVSERLYPVGRLDFDSEGLILMTNDGELAQKLTHPSYQHSKEYRVLLARQPDTEQMATWQRGVVLEDGYKTQRAEVKIESLAGKGAWIRVIMREGRKRQIREIGSMLGLPVVRIVRVRIGNLILGELKPAEWRYLTPLEIKALKEDRPGLGPYPDMTRKAPVKFRPVAERKRTGRTAPPSGPGSTAQKGRSSQDGERASRRTPPPPVGTGLPSKRSKPSVRTGRSEKNHTDTESSGDGYSRTQKDHSRKPNRVTSSVPSTATSRPSRPSGGTVTRPDGTKSQHRPDRPGESHKPSSGVKKSRLRKP